MTITAPTAYAEQRAEIERLRAELDLCLAAMDADHAAKPTHWGIVGDAQRVVAVLRIAIGEGE